MDYLPLFHNLKGRNVLVVGGGEIALRKVRLVQQASALITIVAKEFCADLLAMDASDKEHGCNGLHLITAAYDHSHLLALDQVALMIAATNDRELNRLAASHARAANILANVVDDPGFSTVIFPSIIDRSPIQIAISSGGDAPVLVRLLRTKLEALLPAGLSKLAALAGSFRERVKAKFDSGSDRKAFWEEVFLGPIAEQAYANNLQVAERLLQEKLDATSAFKTGEVYLVGGGPGDPDLLTFKALRLMQQADIVLYDRLVSAEVLNLVRRDATRIYVGKTAGDHPVTQENINQKLVEYARAGNRVVRLKGGDPFIFGRGGEEAAHLARHGVKAEVVPGVTAGIAAPAYVGIPVTHRKAGSSVTFVTGHEEIDKVRPGVDWRGLAQSSDGLVIYMGLHNLRRIAEELVAGGLSVATPAAVIQQGTVKGQRHLVCALGELADRAEAEAFASPSIVVVGQMVAERVEGVAPEPADVEMPIPF